KALQAAIVSRIKIMANLDIAERRLPQDGRIHVAIENKEFDLRVSTLPTVFGEKVVMRILDQSSTRLGMGKLGFTPATLEVWEAIQASLTGHLVLSTIHSNDAPSAATRLVDMGVEPFLISSSVIGVLAQRLARTICLHCKEAYTPPVEALQRLGLKPEQDEEIVFYRGRGCDRCKGAGYKGRIGIYEL